MSVTVYSKPSCGGCIATYRALNTKGIEHRSIDMSEDKEALEFVLGLGHQAAPVVVVRDAEGKISDSWSGFRPDYIAALA